jgi:hypothetical protein
MIKILHMNVLQSCQNQCTIHHLPPPIFQVNVTTASAGRA